MFFDEGTGVLREGFQKWGKLLHGGFIVSA
jgi:hypothetical protein